MDFAIDIISWVLIVSGCFFGLTGALGLFRFPDFYTRIHAASMTDTLCAGLIITGLILQCNSGFMILKLVLVMLTLAYTSPTAVHTLAKTARQEKLEPLQDEKGAKS